MSNELAFETCVSWLAAFLRNVLGAFVGVALAAYFFLLPIIRTMH